MVAVRAVAGGVRPGQGAGQRHINEMINSSASADERVIAMSPIARLAPAGSAHFRT